MEHVLASSLLLSAYGDMAKCCSENLDGVLWFVKTLTLRFNE